MIILDYLMCLPVSSFRAILVGEESKYDRLLYPPEYTNTNEYPY